MKYTNGPWEISHAGTGKDGKFILTEYFVRKPDDDVAIASDIVNPKTGQPSEANARLIAAAPELLEACKDLRFHIEANGKEKELIEYYKPLVRAIAKAEGSNP